MLEEYPEDDFPQPAQSLLLAVGLFTLSGIMGYPVPMVIEDLKDGRRLDEYRAVLKAEGWIVDYETTPEYLQ